MPEIFKTFDEMQLREPLRKAVERMGFQNPTPVQAQTIPLMLEG